MIQFFGAKIVFSLLNPFPIKMLKEEGQKLII
jgi:hypothetical protein